MQKQYLLLSDLFVLSLAFLVLGVLVLAAVYFGWRAFYWSQVVYLLIMATVCVLTWKTAKNAGNAFVLNVLVEAVYDR